MKQRNSTHHKYFFEFEFFNESEVSISIQVIMVFIGLIIGSSLSSAIHNAHAGKNTSVVDSCPVHNSKVVLIDKVVLGGQKKGIKMSHIFGDKMYGYTG